jgi:hypothetical protein
MRSASTDVADSLLAVIPNFDSHLIWEKQGLALSVLMQLSVRVSVPPDS